MGTTWKEERKERKVVYGCLNEYMINVWVVYGWMDMWLDEQMNG